MTDTQRVIYDTLLTNCKPDSNQNTQRFPYVNKYFIRNKTSPYENTNVGKTALLQELYSRLDTANNLPATINATGKNLIYFAVFLSDSYLDLVEYALQSIADNTQNINFDVLFITDEEYKQKLLQKPILTKFNCFFYITETPLSGVRASIRKLTVFDYPEINQYEKILFLDCDAICIKDINNIFNITILPEKLYTGTLKTVPPNEITTPTHGIMFLTDRDAEIYAKNYYNFKPFNAGQFLFYNTQRMKGHFENVRWLIDNWPGELFFEQGPMNYYFVINSISCILITPDSNPVFAITHVSNRIKEQPRVGPVVVGATNTACLTSVEALIKKVSIESFAATLNDDTCIVHFAGTPLGAEEKFKKIKEFVNARKL